MLAVVAREPARVAPFLWGERGSLRSLAAWGRECPHQDGAGVLWRDASGWTVRRRWGRDRFAEFLGAGREALGEVETTLLLAHARKASDKSRLAEEHAHPLERDGIFLAHNGTIRDAERLGVPGDIDSQRLLAWLAREWRPRDLEGLRGALARLLGIVSDYTGIDLLLVAGGDLYVACLHREKAEYYTLRVRAEPDRFVVASEPLDAAGEWRPMENGEVLRVAPDLAVESRRVG